MCMWCGGDGRRQGGLATRRLALLLSVVLWLRVDRLVLVLRRRRRILRLVAVVLLLLLLEVVLVLVLWRLPLLLLLLVLVLVLLRWERAAVLPVLGFIVPGVRDVRRYLSLCVPIVAVIGVTRLPSSATTRGYGGGGGNGRQRTVRKLVPRIPSSGGLGTARGRTTARWRTAAVDATAVDTSAMDSAANAVVVAATDTAAVG